MRLRQPLDSDYLELASWIPDAKACLRWAGPAVSFPFDVDTFARSLAVDDGESHVLSEADQSPVGFGQFMVRTPGAVHLGRLIIAPACRNRGYGDVLVRSLIARAVDATHAGKVTLRVYRDNSPAVALYTRLGFAAVALEADGALQFMERGVSRAHPLT